VRTLHHLFYISLKMHNILTKNQKPKTKNGLSVVIAGGGTGGHLFPGIAVAQEFRECHGVSVTFLTTPKAVTGQILERYGFAWEAIASRALKGQGLISRVRTLISLWGSVRQARARLQDLRPHLVLGIGGHTSGPVGVAAHRLGIPLALHEQNTLPGLTNRFLARLARRIFLSFPDTQGCFPEDRSQWTGNPIRPEFYLPPAERPAEPFTVLLMGGSQGAHHLNLTALAALPFLADLRQRLQFLHLSGAADRETVAAGYRQAGFQAQVEAFTMEVAAWMSRAHLVVCRAGASSLAELTAVGRAAVLVPYPFAANNHQEFNARFLAQAGAAQVVLNKDLTGEVLSEKIRHSLEHPQAREQMEEASRRLARPEAAREIVQGCLELIEEAKMLGTAHYNS
jgi:UDP-N-acetylglucosamine--N-acetylmuramyl-(pentapeptide) pyrophosphoryl-undecaprenol N-acetylglucosamine transferase